MAQVFYCHKCRATYIVGEHTCTGNKYHAIKEMIEGITFDSRCEAAYYCELKLLERAGMIRNLERQVVYEIAMNGVHIANCILDFRYIDTFGQTVIVDVKSGPTRTPVYRLKKRLVEAQYGIRITEVE